MTTYKMAVVDSGRTSSVMSELFELSATTWTVIQSCCPNKEANEVKRVIGHSLVEEACDLHTEASMLIEIWRQMREDTDPGRPHDDDTPVKLLSDPPGVRDKLIQEIKFLVSYLQQRDATSPILAETINNHTVNYVLTQSSHVEGTSSHSTSRPPSSATSRPHSSATSRPPSSATSRPSSSACYGCDTPSSNSSSVIDLLQDHTLSIQEVDNCISNLRSAVRDEIQQRHYDIQLLQGYIDSELSYNESNPTPPTIKELQCVSQKLEKQLLCEEEDNNSTPTKQFPTINHSPLLPIPLSGPTQRLELEDNELATEKRLPATPPPIILPPSTGRPCRTPVNRASKVVRRSLDLPLSPLHPPLSPPPHSLSHLPLSPSHPPPSSSHPPLSPPHPPLSPPHPPPSPSHPPLSPSPSPSPSLLSSHSPSRFSCNNKQN